MSAEDEQDFNRLAKATTRVAEPYLLARDLEIPEIVRRRLFDLVGSEEEIRQAIRLCLEKHHLLIEGAAGVPLAALLKIAERLQGRNVVVVLCGANISLTTLRGSLRTVLVYALEVLLRPRRFAAPPCPYPATSPKVRVVALPENFGNLWGMRGDRFSRLRLKSSSQRIWVI